MRITFLVPGHYWHPIGGYKVIYEYANQLDKRGHTVTLVFPPCENLRTTYSQAPLKRKIRSIRWAIHRRNTQRRRPLVPWFKLRPGVKLQTVPYLDERYIPDADAIFATGWQTAPFVADYGPSKGAKFYLIQHYENWQGEEDIVRQTWTLPLQKIVIAKWLHEKADVEFSEAARTTHIPNGLDFETFRLEQPIEGRRVRIGMLHHDHDWKGTGDGLAAIAEVKQSVPSVEAALFGTGPRPETLPSWIDYTQLPEPHELRAFYNSCSIFVHPSWAEGLPAPPAEAMMCGCALVAASNEGVRDYATDEVNALMAPIKRPDLLAKQIHRLLEDDALRVRIAKAGNEFIQQFTWDRAGEAIERLLLQHVKAASAR
jgi:glycosyltransferase involved in cell wall biosynthesis